MDPMGLDVNGLKSTVQRKHVDKKRVVCTCNTGFRGRNRRSLSLRRKFQASVGYVSKTLLKKKKKEQRKEGESERACAQMNDQHNMRFYWCEQSEGGTQAAEAFLGNMSCELIRRSVSQTSRMETPIRRGI